MRLHRIYRHSRPDEDGWDYEDLTIDWGIGAQLGFGAAMESHPSERHLQIWLGPLRLVVWWMR